VYIGLALFYLYIIATNVFRNMEGMTTTIETIENKKEGATSSESSEDDSADSKKPKAKESDSSAKPADSNAKPKTAAADSKPKPKSDDSADSSN
jgi:hypothetical protein